MNYNYYFFLLENYRKKMNPNVDILSIRKTVYQSYSNESLRQRQRYRHEMARERRAEMESQKLMNLKLKELKEKEKEISQRYTRRNNYGNLIGANDSLRARLREESKNDSSVTVLLPILKKKDCSSVAPRYEGLDYGTYSIPKKMLPLGNEDIEAYEVVKAAHKMNRRYDNQEHREDIDDNIDDSLNGVSGEENKLIDKQDLIIKDSKTNVAKEKSAKRKIKDPIEPQIISSPSYRHRIANRKYNPEQHNASLNRNRGYGNSYNDYRKREGLYEDNGLAVFGKVRNTNTYELLIVDDGPRTVEIRVKQKCCSNSRAFDILTIKENPPKSPNTL